MRGRGSATFSPTCVSPFPGSACGPADVVGWMARAVRRPCPSHVGPCSDGGLAALFAPLQEHARHLLHLSSMHWAAAAVSVVRLVVVAIISPWDWLSALVFMASPGTLAAGDLLSLIMAIGEARNPSWP